MAQWPRLSELPQGYDTTGKYLVFDEKLDIREGNNWGASLSKNSVGDKEVILGWQGIAKYLEVNNTEEGYVFEVWNKSIDNYVDSFFYKRYWKIDNLGVNQLRYSVGRSSILGHIGMSDVVPLPESSSEYGSNGFVKGLDEIQVGDKLALNIIVFDKRVHLDDRAADFKDGQPQVQETQLIGAAAGTDGAWSLFVCESSDATIGGIRLVFRVKTSDGTYEDVTLYDNSSWLEQNWIDFKDFSNPHSFTVGYVIPIGREDPQIRKHQFLGCGYILESIIPAVPQYPMPPVERIKRKLNCIEIIQETALRLGMLPPNDDSIIKFIKEKDAANIDRDTQLLMGALNQAARNAAIAFNWKEFTIRMYFYPYCNSEFGWNPIVEGFDIEFIAPGYDGILSNSFYIPTEEKHRRFIENVTIDEFTIRKENDKDCRNGYIFQSGYVCFAKKLPETKIYFTYKTAFPFITITSQGDKIPSAYVVDGLDQVVMDDEVLILGTIINYKNYVGLDSQLEQALYNQFLEHLKTRSESLTVIREFGRNWRDFYGRRS
jgi:hypothetical protein